MKVSDYIAYFLYKQDVDHVFELSGGMITHLLDSLYEFKKIKIVTMHHEQSAAFAVDGYGRTKKIPSVAMATSGPGATNLLTGIASCYFDSTPAIFITGQVNVHEQKGNRNIRQLGFQETDIVSMSAPVTKKSFKVNNAAEIPGIFHEAFQLAISGRPGPVLIDIPMNVQREDIPLKYDDINKVEKIVSDNSVSVDILEQLYKDIKSSKQPLLLAGRGVSLLATKSLFLNFAELVKIPVVTSLLGLDAIPFNHPLRAGFIGSYGNRWANMVIGEADLLIVVGSRLDIRQTGSDVTFFGDRKIYHIDIESSEINNRVMNCIPVIADLEVFFQKALNEFSKLTFNQNDNWLTSIEQLKTKWPDTEEIKDTKGINPNKFLHQLSAHSQYANSYILDVGSHQMWAAQSLEIGLNQSFITSGGMGAMGFALPAAIGSSIAANAPVIMISGDGGMQLNIQELQTIKRNNLPIKMVVLNNQSLGMIRQFQDSYFDGKHQSTVWGYSAPDFEKIANAYGINAATIKMEEDISEGIKKLWQKPNEPFLLQVMIDPKANVYPKIAFGKPITEMEPFSKPFDMEGT